MAQSVPIMCNAEASPPLTQIKCTEVTRELLHEMMCVCMAKVVMHEALHSTTSAWWCMPAVLALREQEVILGYISLRQALAT